MWTYNGKTIKEGKAWTDDNGIQHPANWHVWSKQEKEAIGLVEVIPQAPPDSRLYWWSQNADGTITSTPKELEDVSVTDPNTGSPVLDEKGNQLVQFGVKTQLINEVKSQQGSLLSSTDWAIVRQADTGISVPANIKSWRDSIRITAGIMENEIAACTSVGAVEKLFLKYTLNADGTTTKTGILYDWPELEE